MNYHVDIHPAAEADFDDHFSHIAKRSFEGAIRWEDEFEAMKNRLAKNPKLHGYAREETWLRMGLRAAPFKTKSGNLYHAVYLIDVDRVVILRVRGQGQPDLTTGDLTTGDLPNG